MGAGVMGATRLLIAAWLLLSLPRALALVASPAAQFDQANKLYEQGRFAEAAGAYEALAQSGAATASVWFNLGNAAYKAGQLGRAIAAYRMAESLTPRDALLRANLQFVRGKVYSDERSRLPFSKTVTRLGTLNEWTLLTVVLLWAFFSVLACGEAVGRRYLKTAVAILLAALVSGTGLALAWQDYDTAAAIVVAKEATARFGPLDESQAAFQLRDGAELTVLSTKDEWLMIRDAENRTGWIRRDEVAVLAPPRRV